MITPITFALVRVELKEKALVDSRAMENFIDERTWEWLKIRRKTLDKPTKVYNVDVEFESPRMVWEQIPRQHWKR
jgi:hypothetical protein